MGIDHLGPFRLTTNGNRYLLVAIDYLSKWVIAKPVASTAATLIRTFLETEVIAQHGYPHRIITDRGTGFTAKLLHNQLQQWGISHSLVTTGHHQSNGQVERINRCLVMAFKPFVNPTHSDWDTKITHATLAINTAKQESTKASPFEIVYGRQPEFPN